MNEKYMDEITKDTKLNQLLQRYPWLVDEAVKMDSRFRILRSPVGKLFLKNATIGELSSRAGIDAEEIICRIKDMLKGQNT